MATEHWTGRAACRGLNTKLFFPVTAGVILDEIRAICEACPVRADCLDHAIARREHGIWAATTEEERKILRRRLRRRVDVDDAADGSKACAGCGETKPLTEYYGDGRAADGRQARCKTCHIDDVTGRHRGDRVEVPA